ncbi:MAG: discoidin domain-containing protein, partial [Verrucomicrobia bacterium]|nr:discoidin domain-containing protein [Verrucomicrobiota bacterium]
MKSAHNIETVKQNHISRLVPAAGLLTTTTSNKGGRALGLLLGLFLCAALTATAQPTVISHPIAIDEMTGVVTLTVNYSEDMDYTTVTDPNNYVLVDSPAGKAALTSASMPSSTSVSFEVTGLYGGDDYTLNISGVKDAAQANTVTTNLTGTVPGLRLAILEGVGTASASSSPYGAASNARDGNIATYNHTFNNDNEWWELDLGSAQGPIGGLAIYFRQDCCYERNHDLLFTVMDANRAPLWTAYIHQAPPSTPKPLMTNFVVGTPVMGRYVRIEHPPGVANQDFIHFGEVRLLGPSTGLVIGGQPASLSVPQNKPASFTVGVEGTAPITYQWKHEGANVPGGTNATLSIASAKPADAGNYVVVVQDATGRQRTSVPATLNVVIDTVPPIVTGHSWSQDTF